MPESSLPLFLRRLRQAALAGTIAGLMALGASPASAGLYSAIAGGYDCANLSNCADADLQDAAHVSVRAGFDFGFSNLVPGSNWLKPGILIGLEGYFNYSRRALSQRFAGETFMISGATVELEDFTFRARPEYQYGISGRLGLQHRLGQIYGLGGYGWEPWTYGDGGFTFVTKVSGQPDVRTNFRFRDVFDELMLTGWHVGGGVLLTPARSLGVFLELRYSEMSGEFRTRNAAQRFGRDVTHRNYQISSGLRFGF